MKRILTALFKIVLCIFIIAYAEEYFFNGLSLININVNSLSPLIKELISLTLYILICGAVYLVYKEYINSDYRRFKRNIFPNILMAIVFFVALTMGIAVVSYLCHKVASSFHIKYIPLEHINIMNKKVDIHFIIFIIKYIIIIPFVKTVIYLLGCNELFSSKNKGIIFSGIIAAIVAGLSMKGSLLFILVNVIECFVLFATLAYIYRKNNNNIWYSITTIILYTMLASLLLSRVL